MLARRARILASKDMIEVRVPARVHAGLIDLSASGYRTNGGIGWALDGPELVVTACPASQISIEDRRKHPLSIGEIEEISALLTAIADKETIGRAHFRIEGDLPAHRGLGGGTAFRLAAIECLMLISGREISETNLITLSGRGGTSGVGIRTYFEGGFVFDIGHRGGTTARPSRDRAGCGKPLAMMRFDMPSWQMGVLVDDLAPSVPIEIERQLFATVTPIEFSDVCHVLYHMIFGIIPAVAEDDIDTFAEAVDRLQVGAWKQAEWVCHGARLRSAAQSLRDAGARGVGLSSIGPTLFFIADRLKVSALPGGLASTVRLVKGANHGRIIVTHCG